jgi:hypothetical protein
MLYLHTSVDIMPCNLILAPNSCPKTRSHIYASLVSMRKGFFRFRGNNAIEIGMHNFEDEFIFDLAVLSLILFYSTVPHIAAVLGWF